jgi:hypothetical protein
MSNDLSLTIFDKNVSHAVEKRILCCESVKREKIFAGEMSCGRITEIGGYRQGALLELITQRGMGELIDRGNHKNAQDEHHACTDSTDLPFEAHTS